MNYRPISRPPDYSQQNRDNGNYQKYVDETAAIIVGEAQYPQNYEDHGD